jgi:hypothetical protein
MRNSLLPIILLVITSAFAWWLIRDGAERGAGGPEVLPGIYRLPQKAGQVTKPAELTVSTAHTGSAPADAGTWRVILIAGDDAHPFTNAAILALGEELTRRGCIAVLAPVVRDRPEPLPLNFDGTVRIAHQEGEPSAEQPGAVQCTLKLILTPTRLPPAHPAARWLPDLPASTATTMTLSHRSTPVAAPPWPHWYAAIGRSCALELLNACGTPAQVTDTIERIRLTAWTQPGQAGPGTTEASVSIYGRIPSPPQTDIAEHVVAFQHPFVRGWIGDFSPVPVTARDLTTRSAREELLRRLARGGWSKGPDLGSDLVFNKDDRATDGSPIHRSVSISASGFMEWQERPNPTQVWQGWITSAAAAAAAGDADADAKAQLARHRTTAGIPADLK